MAARTFDAFTIPKAGVIWGLSVPQLLFLSVATFPAWMAISSQRWLAGIMWVPVWLLLLFLTVVPLGGRPAVGWLAAAAAFAIAGLNGWLTFRSKAATGTLRDLDELDMPGALTGVEVLDGPPIGLTQRRVAVIKHCAARTWAITARIEHDGIAMATDALCNRYADGLTELLDTAACGELISEIHLMVRTTPDDCTERELWLRANITPDAPVTSVATQIEHLRWSQAGVRTEAFITLVIPDNRLSKEARHMGGATDGHRPHGRTQRRMADLAGARAGRASRVRPRRPGRPRCLCPRRSHRSDGVRGGAVGIGGPLAGVRGGSALCA